MRLLSACCALAMAFGASAAWASDPVKIPGTHVELAPPDGFTVSKKFAGLEGDNASVLIVELPGGNYDQLAEAISTGAMAKQGVEIIGSGEDLKELPFKARAFRARQSAQGIEFDKWILVAEGGTGLTLVNVSANKGSPALSDDKVKTMFKSVRIAAATAGDPVDTLPFTIKPSARFTTRQTIGGMGLVLASAPLTAENAGQPGIVITRVAEEQVPKEQQEQMLAVFSKAMQGAKIEKAEPSKPIKIGDYEGLQQLATGEANGEPRKILLVMLFAPKGAYALIGIAAPDKFDAALPDIRATMETFHAK